MKPSRVYIHPNIVFGNKFLGVFICLHVSLTLFVFLLAMYDNYIAVIAGALLGATLGIGMVSSFRIGAQRSADYVNEAYSRLITVEVVEEEGVEEINLNK